MTIEDQFRDRINLFFSFFEKPLDQVDYAGINRLLENLNLQKHPLWLIGNIRLTYSVRDKLPAWIPARDRAYEEFKRRGLDADLEFVGLFKENECGGSK